MKALLSRQAGGPETLVLEEIPEPVPGRGEVRIKVRAVGVNFPDLSAFRVAIWAGQRQVAVAIGCYVIYLICALWLLRKITAEQRHTLNPE